MYSRNREGVEYILKDVRKFVYSVFIKCCCGVEEGRIGG